MKFLVLLEVDEEKLSKIGYTFEQEMGWAVRHGIFLAKSMSEKDCTGYEYAVFVWNNEREEYEQIGRPVMTEVLCRNRFKEYAEKGWLMKCYDTSRVIFKKRIVAVFEGTWEEISCSNCHCCY